MTHLKRNKIGKFWSIPKKGTKYLAVSMHNQKTSIPLVVVLRDVLKIIRNKKELKRLISENQILVNNKQIRETNFPIGLFDIIKLLDAKKNYKAILSENKKMVFKEVSDKESESKIYKIVDRKILPGKKIQLNLMGGRNILSNEKANVGDSILLNLKDKKITKIIPLGKGKNVFVIKGRHMGISGKIEEIMSRGNKKLAKILNEDKKINVWIKNIIVIE